ncbi:MAG: complex I subunit 5 family protein [Dehalococcoidia bacterium]
MELSQHFAIYAIVTPLFAAVLVPIISLWKKNWGMPLTALVMACSLVLSALLVPQVRASRYLSYHLGSWEPPFGIELRIDFLGALMMVLISAICLIVAVYSRKYIAPDSPKDGKTFFFYAEEMQEEKRPVYYSLLLVICASMLGFVATGDVFNMFVFFELMAICSYALVAIPGTRLPIRAAIKYMLMAVPAAMLVLLGIGLLYSVTGTLNMADLSERLSTSGYDQVVTISYVLLLVGFAVKAAIFPLHVWLPDAHSKAPSPVSALLSGLIVKMGIVGMIRVTYSVYDSYFPSPLGWATSVLAWTAGVAIIYGAIMAIRQSDLKLMIAYSTIMNLGYITLGFGLADVTALVGGVYHIMGHGVAKVCFFLCAGSIISRSGYQKIEDLKGAYRKMPLTCAAFALASLSIVGIPPTAGFVAKWYLVSGSLNTGHALLGAVVIAGSVMAAIYCFRVVYYMFFLPPSDEAWQDVSGEASPSMVGATLLLAVASLALGIASSWILPSLRDAAQVLLLGP